MSATLVAVVYTLLKTVATKVAVFFSFQILYKDTATWYFIL